MPTVFELIKEDFKAELDAIRLLVETFDVSEKPPKARAAAVNSATLLVAATFEEYIRQSAREFARLVVTNTASLGDLPKGLSATAWRRAMQRLAKVRFDSEDQQTRNALLLGVETTFSAVRDFVRGDLTKDIYSDLIHNENNMRPDELNAMFKVSGLTNVCVKLCEIQPIKDHFDEAEQEKAHGKLRMALDELMERRNRVAHALNPNSFTGASQIKRDLDMLGALASSLCQVLDAATGPAPTPPVIEPTPALPPEA
ncbi:MAG TPA: HEPN domain-containing protein [Bauldia sp.]|nr:HEPN domain-containing protein [Bauldia sp.]